MDDLTPTGLTRLVKSKKQVLDCEVTVSTTSNEINVFVKFKFFHRVKTLFYSDYGQQFVSDLGLELIDKLPPQVTLKIRLLL